MPILSLFTLPFRAPLLGGLFLVALVMGNHWTVNQSIYAENQSISVSVFWLIQLIQVIAVVVVFTIPDLLMRQVSMLMASSRVISLVVTLLMVIVLGLYVMRLHRLTDVMILASAVLLARLDLIRIGIVPPPLLTIIGFTAVLLSGIGLGCALPNPAGTLLTEAAVPL